MLELVDSIKDQSICTAKLADCDHGEIRWVWAAQSTRPSEFESQSSFLTFAGLAEWPGCGLPSRLRGFDSRSPLHFRAIG